jgi:cellulose synthase/poly-beta-1,6-N-acetylglucosamine synthase-like glycosyltransferase
MESILSGVYWIVLIILAIPIVVFSIQIIFAVLPGFKPKQIQSSLAKIAVLIPAHNEARGIEETLSSIQAQATEFTRVVVIADNCVDNTAELARAMGVEAIERQNKDFRGKGYALDFGIQFLKQNPPEILIIFDADCQISTDAISALAQGVTLHQRAVQGLYLIQSPQDAKVATRLSEFAYVVKSWTRALGYYRLGMPMLLMGSGMAFPWKQIADSNLAHGSIVEDMKLGLDLTNQRLAPKFCPEAFVSSLFPDHSEGEQSQRKRWEHGHLGMIAQEGLPLLWRGFKTVDIQMIAMALDLCVPPLALLFLLALLFAIISASIAMITGQLLPWVGGILLFVIFNSFVFLAWIKHGRNILSMKALLTFAPVYAFRKIKLYLGFFVNRQVEWVKSRKD